MNVKGRIRKFEYGGYITLHPKLEDVKILGRIQTGIYSTK